MKTRIIIAVLVGLFLTTACQLMSRIATRTSETTAPENSVTSTLADVAQLTTPTSMPQTQLSSSEGSTLPPSLYFLGEQSIWLMRPGSTTIEQLTPNEWGIAGFDVWSEDNRIAYGTSGGQLYVMMPDHEPHLLHDVSAESPYPAVVLSVAWSPDGTRLAYSVGYDSEKATFEAGSPSYPSGLWVLDIEGSAPTWLLSNRYMSAGGTDVNALLTFADPAWSPDGTALMLRGYYWEWFDALWLDPFTIDPPHSNEANLHDSPDGDWAGGSWTRDSQSILLSQQLNRSLYGDFLLVERASLEIKQLIDGESTSFRASDAQELPSGIVFLGGGEGQKSGLYLGRLEAENFVYTPVGPEQLCNSGMPGHVEWDSSGQWGVLVCEYDHDPNERDEVHIVTLNGENIDITPYLEPLGNVETLKVLWGE